MTTPRTQCGVKKLKFNTFVARESFPDRGIRAEKRVCILVFRRAFFSAAVRYYLRTAKRKRMQRNNEMLITLRRWLDLIFFLLLSSVSLLPFPKLETMNSRFLKNQSDYPILRFLNLKSVLITAAMTPILPIQVQLHAMLFTSSFMNFTRPNKKRSRLSWPRLPTNLEAGRGLLMRPAAVLGGGFPSFYEVAAVHIPRVPSQQATLKSYMNKNNFVFLYIIRCVSFCLLVY